MHNKKKTSAEEELLANELELISLLKQHPDIFIRHPQLLTSVDVPHTSGSASSLIERQVSVLRENLKSSEHRLRELMDIARDNERLAKSRHRFAVNLLGAHDLDDVVSCALTELSDELNADFVVIKLFSDDEETLASQPERYIARNDAVLTAFQTMMKHHNPVCGRVSDEQCAFLFGDDAASIGSAAVIPLVAGSDLGLLGLGGSDATRFDRGMATDFLSQIGELVSTALAVHLTDRTET